jgi:CheY-like chemotaxis protein/HPt (histidine-containing phosphotransfer) domain-containing protein
LVEDNTVNQEVAVGMLEAMGCRVATSLNGRDALMRLLRERFDLILMDCEMPVMDGFEAAQRIRAAEQRSSSSMPRTPIVAVTAHALASVHEKCLQAGMDDFLVKPFDEQQLGEALRRWLPSRERPPKGHAAGADRGAGSNVIDLATIDKIRAIKGADGSGLLRRVVSQFADTSPTLLATIRAQTAGGDIAAVWRAAHSLKSSAEAIGAHRLAHCCAEIERAGRDRGILPEPRRLDALEAELAAATKSLEALT